jgi:hypothetical protein
MLLSSIINLTELIIRYAPTIKPTQIQCIPTPCFQTKGAAKKQKRPAVFAKLPTTHDFLQIIIPQPIECRMIFRMVTKILLDHRYPQSSNASCVQNSTFIARPATTSTADLARKAE